MTLLLLTGIASATVAQNRVRAKIGIQIHANGRLLRARAAHTIHAGDRLRIFIIPEDDVYIHVVHEAGVNITLLNGDGHRHITKKGTILIFPYYDDYYKIDGRSKIESFTIICSPNEISELSEIFNSKTVAYNKWVLIQNQLMEKSRVHLIDKPEKPFEIAGDVRGITTDPFFKKLQIFSGNRLLLKRYDFEVEK